MALSPCHPQSQTRCFFPDKLGYLVPVGFLAQHTMTRTFGVNITVFVLYGLNVDPVTQLAAVAATEGNT